VEVLVKISLGQWEEATRRAAFTVLAAVWMLCAGPVTLAAAQGGPGLRAGFSANPDQFFFGGHYVTGPVWNRLRFQPNVEAGFGDDRTLVAFNMEFGYWMPVNPDWQAYVGGGPAMNLVSSDGKHGDDVGPGLTVCAGLRRRGGLFFEMKVGAFDSPDFKLTVGYTFR
jgi:hypothetical protein